MQQENNISVFRGKILHFLDDPNVVGDSAWEYFEDGLLVIDNGYVSKLGKFEQLKNEISGNLSIQHHPNHLIIPGFIDTHIHYPQTEIIGAYGEQLLSWLNTYTFPTEQKFSDENYAREVSAFFLNELLKNGTTTALVFGTSHKNSVDVFFDEAHKLNLRMIAGKVMMDRNAPEELCDTAASSYEDSKELIEKWHGVGRLSYAVTPRFAPTSTPEQLEKAGNLLAEYDDLYLHTHLSENKDEIEWVKSLFSDAKHYLDVYDQAGLLGRRSVFAHSIHLCDHECERLADTHSNIAHCPTSNLFLGSGLFPLKKFQQHKINIGLGTDIGGGTSFSMFKTMDEAYKIQQLRGDTLSPFQSLYLATLGGAKVLDIHDKVGNFSIGNEADFMLINLEATPLVSFRLKHCQSIQETLFVLNTIGDDRLIDRTYSLGKCVYSTAG